LYRGALRAFAVKAVVEITTLKGQPMLIRSWVGQGTIPSEAQAALISLRATRATIEFRGEMLEM
jgi:hypothetical protein